MSKNEQKTGESNKEWVRRTVDAYLLKKLGLRFTQIIGYKSSLKKPITALMTAEPERGRVVQFRVKISSKTEIKILGLPHLYSLQPKGYSNFLLFRIVNSPVKVGDLIIGMEELVKAIKK